MVFLFLGLHTLPVDDLMQSKVQEYDCCFICTICGKSISLNNMGKHMRNIHPSCDGAYYCPPPCDKYFKISRYFKKGIYEHIRKWHYDWEGENYDNFAARSSIQW